MLNILHVASGDLWAGAEVQLFHLASALYQNKHVNTLVVLLNHGQLEQQLLAQGVDVVVFDESKLSSFTIYKRLKEHANKHQIQVMHSHREKENILVSAVSWSIGCKSVRTIHGAPEFEVHWWQIKRWLVTLADRFCGIYLQQKIIAVSDDLKSKLAQQFSETKLMTINNSVNTEYIEQRANEAISVGIGKDRTTIGFVGRFVPVKQVSLFFEIASKVIHREAGDRIDFYMLGDGPQYDEIAARVKRDQLTSRLNLLGFVENSAPYIKKFDFLMFTSRHEGLPMTLLEAMTLQTPVISTCLPSIMQVLDGEQGGYFIDSDSSDEIAEFVCREVVDKAKSTFKAKRARSILNKNYALASNIEKYEALYHQLLV